MSHHQLSKPLEAEIKAFCGQSNLTPRESEILAILAEGLVRIKDVADRLQLSPNTVNNHVNSIFMKTRTRSKSQLLAGLLNHVATELQWARYFKRSPRVLIVDRDVVITKAITQILESRGFAVALATDSVGGLTRLSDFGPQFVLADLETVGGAVPTFMKSVMEHCCGQIVLIGSGAGISDRSHAMNEGAIDLIEKPIDPILLLQVLMCHYIEDDGDRACYLEMEAQPARAAGEELILTRENIGTGGVFLSSHDLKRILGAPVSIGEQVELKLRLDRVAEPIPVRGQVVWSRGDGDGASIGVRFMRLPRSGREWLASFLRENEIRSYIPAGSAASN